MHSSFLKKLLFVSALLSSVGACPFWTSHQQLLMLYTTSCH
jgi:hypothetical protein